MIIPHFVLFSSECYSNQNQQVQQNGKASKTKAHGIIIALVVVVGFRGLFVVAFSFVFVMQHLFQCVSHRAQRSAEWQPVAKKAKNVSQRLSAPPPKSELKCK